MVRPLSFNPIPPCYIPHPHGSPPSAPLPPSPLRLAPFAVGTAVPHPRRRRGLRPPPASAPPCSSVHTTVGAATVASGRWRSLLTSFANKAASSVPHPSTPSLAATSPTLTARRLRRLCPSHHFRLAPLLVGTAVPHPRRRRGLRPPPASAYPPCPGVRTTAVSTFSSDRHSIAVPAPIRWFRRRRFPLAYTLGLIVPDRTARLWSSHHRVASLRRLRRSSPTSSCAIAASPHAASFRHRSSHHHRCRWRLSCSRYR